MIDDDLDQMDLLSEPESDGWASAPSAVFPEARRDQRAEKRGPGRPKGAANKKTQALEKLYQAKGFRDPLLFQGEVMSSHPADLLRWFIGMEAAVLGIDEDEAMARYRADDLNVPSIAEIVAMQIKVADNLAPYLHGKMPIRDLSDQDEKLPVLIVDLGDGPVTPSNEAEEVLSIGQMVGDQHQQNQSLSKDAIEKPHGNAPHETAKPLTNIDK